jgi:uncharacterized protein (DUF1778 family)
MGRPAKNPEDRKDYHLRVPLDERQREQIERAAALAHADKAEWARGVLLAAAQKQIARQDQKESSRR